MSRNLNPADGLELFLDTICNTFGGILFILLFVVLLLKGTERRYFEDEANNVRQEDVEQLEAQLGDINAEIEKVEGQRNAIADKLEILSPTVKESALGILEEQKSQFDRLLEEQTSLNKDIDKAVMALNNDDNSLTEEEADLRQEVRNLEKRIADASAKAASAKNTERREQSLPQLRDTDTNYVGLVLCFGRLYKLHNFNRYNKDSRELNTDEFVVVKSFLGNCHVSPKPWCGIDLQDMDTARREIMNIVSPFSTIDYRISLVVCDDSFRYFGPVSATLKELGFMIEPVIFSEFIDMGISDRGGSEARAQ